MSERLTQMRNLKKMKDIVAKLEIVEKIKEPLQSLLDDITTLLQQGNEWINNIGNKTYQEMKELLDSEIAKFLRQCFYIASNGRERCSETELTVEVLDQASNFESVDVASTRGADNKDNEHILEHLEELTANFTSHTDILQRMKQKFKNQEKSLKSISKLKQQTEEKFEEMMKELHDASNFMSHLSKELNETKEQIQDKKIEEISQNVVNYLEQRDLIAQKQEKVDTLKKEIKRLTDELESMNEKLTTQECKIDQLKGEKDEVLQELMIKEQDFVKLQTEYAQAIKSLETKTEEIVQLKKMNVFEIEALRKKDEESNVSKELEDVQRCIEIVLKKERKLDDEGVRTFWSGETISMTP